MIYQRKIREIRSRKKTLPRLLALCALILLCLFSFPSFTLALSSFAGSALSPLLKARNSIVALLPSALGGTTEDLNAQYEAEKLQVSALLEENSRLNSMLGRNAAGKTVVGYVLAKPNRSPYDTLLIDAGKNVGIENGMLVLAYGNVPIGRIAEARIDTALVTLFSSPGQTQDVEVGTEKVSVSAVGAGGGNFRALLPKDTSVGQGDLVMLPGNPIEPIGMVEKIEKSDAETFAHLYFKSTANVFELSEVFVRIASSTQ